MRKIVAPVDAFIGYIKNHGTPSLVSGIGILAAVTLLRTFIENYSNPEPFGGFTSWFIVLGFFLYFAGVMLMMTALLSFVLKQKSSFVFGALVLSSPVIVIAPIFDLAVSGGKGYCMSYLLSHGFGLFHDFITFFGPLTSCGITPGIRFEVVLVLIGVGMFAYRLTRNSFKTLLSVLGTYVIVFSNLAAPGIMVTIAHGFTSYIDTNLFFSNLLNGSLLPVTQSYISTSSIYVANYANGSIFTARLSWIICLVFTLVVMYQQNKIAWKAYLKDFRTARIVYYASLGLFGMWLAFRLGKYVQIPHSFPDILGYMVFFTVIALGFTFAATTNDLVDIPIDAVTNTNRPLITGALTVTQYKDIALLLGLFIVSGALLINYSFFICTLIFHICFYLYSVPPLRLKRHFLSGDALLALAGLVTVMSGYAFFSINPSFDSFPLRLALFIFCFLFIIVNIRDFKDIKGDAQEGIQTLPVVLGEKKARILIGVLIFIGGLVTGTYLLPYFFALATTFYVVSTTFLILMLVQEVDERLVFLLMYITIIIAAFVL
jgi:4-hydroxybenzoate polyprenyltransferase